ncbi:MAG TPA: carboxypeptidase-like regulatory domain-containing protein [Gemmatimonadales bacterium]|nr:carboxypeptidase-like regulatory domain-containing protein [Gemmatimonadales bacterium]
MIRTLSFLLLLAQAPTAQESVSEVTGRVKFEGEYKSQLLNSQVDSMKHGAPLRGDKDVFSEHVVLGSKGELANVLVRVKGPVKGEFPAPVEPVTIDATDYQLRPRVSVLRPGQTLVLKNSIYDRFNFEVRTERSSQFNVGIARGESREMKLKEPEIGIRVQHTCCPWQFAWIHVIEHPFFAVTGADGTFKIKGLPAGTYEIEAWHEKFGVQTATVTLGAKEVKSADFAFKGAENK